jgi:hypothetical protein
MANVHEIWIKPCEAARDIRAEFGLDTALGDLVAETFLTSLSDADHNSAAAADLTQFAGDIQPIFKPTEPKLT